MLCVHTGELMHKMLVMRAVPSAELSAGSRAVRRLSAVRATAVRAPLSRPAFAASPARQAVLTRDNIASLESYAGPPPLPVVPWTKEASNTVTLTGTVGAIDVRRLATGKTKASLRLAVRKTMPSGAEPETDWFDVEVWNELAEQVAEHASKGSKLVVSGKLVQDKWTDKETGMPRSVVRITAFNVAMVEPYRNESMNDGSSMAAPARAPAAKPMAAAPAAAPESKKPGMAAEEKEAHFLDLLYYPQNWYDNRPQPEESKRPDFKHKSSDLALWLEDLKRPSRLPAYVADYMGHRGQDPPPKWTPPSPEDGTAGPDASASPF